MKLIHLLLFDRIKKNCNQHCTKGNMTKNYCWCREKKKQIPEQSKLNLWSDPLIERSFI
jgi:hypothetical protein